MAKTSRFNYALTAADQWYWDRIKRVYTLADIETIQEEVFDAYSQAGLADPTKSAQDINECQIIWGLRNSFSMTLDRLNEFIQYASDAQREVKIEYVNPVVIAFSRIKNFISGVQRRTKFTPFPPRISMQEIERCFFKHFKSTEEYNRFLEEMASAEVTLVDYLATRGKIHPANSSLIAYYATNGIHLKQNLNQKALKGLELKL